ncbi:MAG: SBBP repeat-containing protein [Saprospiraceae bacterium]
MKIKFLLLFFSFFLCNIALAQLPYKYNLKGFGGISVDQGFSILSDSKNDVILGGYFRNEVNFNFPVSTWTLKSKGSEDIFINKYTPDGILIWAVGMGGIGPDRCTSSAVDSKDNIYITGAFRDTVDFNSGDANFRKVSAGSNDVFIAKLNSEGNLVWVKQIKGKLDDTGKSITVDSDGNVFLTGVFQSSIEFEGSPQFNMTTVRNYDVFIAKLDADGNFIWAKQIGGTGDDIANTITVDPSNQIIVMGTYNSDIDFDPGVNVFKLLQTGVYPNMFVLKLNGNGEFVWAKQIASENIVIPYTAKTDPLGNIYSIGTFRSKVDFDPDANIFNLTSPGVSGDAFILKLNKDGNLVWAKQIGGRLNEIGLGLTLDSDNNIYTTGCYEEGADFDPGPNEFIMHTNGIENNNDIFISKLNSNGEFLWAGSINGDLEDIGFSVCVDKNLRIHSTGIFSGNVVFKLNNDSTWMTSNGGTDILFQSLDQLIVRVEDHQSNEAISLFPNPCLTDLNIEFLSNNELTTQISLIDINGKNILAKSLPTSFGKNNWIISTSKIQSGIYTLKLNQQSTSITSKIVVE